MGAKPRIDDYHVGPLFNSSLGWIISRAPSSVSPFLAEENSLVKVFEQYNSIVKLFKLLIFRDHNISKILKNYT